MKHTREDRASFEAGRAHHVVHADTVHAARRPAP
jgi:hypothetical protein